MPKRYFAQYDRHDRIIKQVIVVDENDCLDSDGNYSESVGAVFCKSRFGHDWVEGSRDGSIRMNPVGIGYSYYPDLGTDGAFVSPLVPGYESWILNTTTAKWDPPISKPTLTDEEIAANKHYVWNDSAYQADNTQGWELRLRYE